MRELSIQHILNRVDELPELPQIAFKAIQLLNNPETDVGRLAEVISSDQALTAKLLRLCNSAFYGLSRKVTTISEAVLIVGFSSIKSLVLMITTQSSMNKGLLGYKMSPGDFWKHSISVAEVSRFLAQRINYPEPEECFIAGLIHDIGKMVLNQFALPEVYKANNLHKREGLPLYLAEREVINFDHAAIGGGLAERWNFPPILVEAIYRHHSLEAFEENGYYHPLPTMVGTADILVKLFGQNSQAEAEFNQHQQIIEKILGITKADLPQLLPILEKRVEDTSQLAMLIT